MGAPEEDSAGAGRGAGARFLIAAVMLIAMAIGVQVYRDRAYAGLGPLNSDILYVGSSSTARHVAVSNDAVLADVYWMRALQHYGYYRLHQEAPERYHLLYPLLDLTTTLDPNFTVAYRFGAIFLSEADPGGAGRPDLAIKLLQKGVSATPERWQYYHDIGFIYYWNLSDYKQAAEWFDRGGQVPGSPWWLRTYAAVMLTRGGDREASRAMWRNLQATSDNDWVRSSAELRLAQLDALDQIDALKRVRDEFQRRTGRLPESWQDLIETGLLRGVPMDPSGTAYSINAAAGEVTVSPNSKLHPLPTEPEPGRK